MAVGGFPVVLSDRGAPFVAVEKGAPLATLAENGRGLPIRVVDKGAPPLIIQGYNVWSPADLFENGEFGTWYDPSFLDTLFQDTSGTTPAVPGSPVGLVLDKSRGFKDVSSLPEKKNEGVLTHIGSGPSDGNYDPETGMGRSTRISGTVQHLTAFSPSGASCLIDVECTGANNATGLALRDAPNAPALGVIAPSQRRTLLVRPSTGVLYLAAASQDNWVDFTIHSIKFIPGNHLSQPTTAARPILARMPKTGRRNLLTWTEDFSNSVWVKPTGTITPSDAVAPDGSMNAVKLGVGTRLYQTYSLTSPTVTFFGYIRTGTAVFGVLNSASRNLSFNADTKTFSAIGSNISSYGYEEVANGFYKVWLTTDAGPTYQWGFSSPSVEAIVWGAQLELGSVATPYQHVRSAYDVTEEGVPDTYSLVYDLADDALTTTLPQAINGDILIAGTKGSIIEPVSYAAGSSFSLGPSTYTGGAPGVMSAVGGVVGLLLIDRTLTQNERDNLLSYYADKGAGGLLP